MPTIEQAAADNLIMQAMVQEKESIAISLLNSANRIDPNVNVNHYHKFWIARWKVVTRKERNK